jgi:purine-binding chemotaxis protein CheW
MNKPAVIDDANTHPFCTFTLAGERFAIPTVQVREVHTQTTFAPVPHTPAEVLGFVNLRSRLYLVVDARRLVGKPPADPTGDSRLVLLKNDVAESLGLLVDSVGDIVNLSDSQLEKSADLEPGTTRLVVGVGKMQHELVTLMDPRAIVPTIERLIRNRSTRMPL